MANKVLHLFTAEYPYGFKSEPFLETEIGYLAENFDQIFIYPSQKVEGTRELPSNCEIQDIFVGETLSKIKKIFLLINKVTLASAILRTEIKDKGRKNFLKNKKLYLDILANQLYKFEILTKNSILKQSDVYYDYWFIDSALALSMAYKKALISQLFIRAHRFDLYDEDWPHSRVPFRCFTYKHSKAVSFISHSGKSYFLSKINKCAGNADLIVSRLGIEKVQYNNLPSKENNIFHLVSCSGVTERKQVLQIANLLKHTNKILKWTHFGDGPLFRELEHISNQLPENISVQLKGHCKNEDVLKFYMNEYVDGFISLSVSEGVPVSMMETISFGIPILARNVGGIPEIVNETTGILINENDDPKQKLNEFLGKKWDRKAIIAFQHANFDATKNYTNFTKILCGEK